MYEVPHARPIVTGAGDATVLWLGPTRARPRGHEARPVPRQGSLVALLACDERLRLARCRRNAQIQAAHAGLVGLSFAVNVSRGLEDPDGLTPPTLLQQLGG